MESMTPAEMFRAIQEGLVTQNDFESWYYEVRDQAVRDAEYAASAYGE